MITVKDLKAMIAPLADDCVVSLLVEDRIGLMEGFEVCEHKENNVKILNLYKKKKRKEKTFGHKTTESRHQNQ